MMARIEFIPSTIRRDAVITTQKPADPWLVGSRREVPKIVVPERY